MTKYWTDSDDIDPDDFPDWLQEAPDDTPDRKFQGARSNLAADLEKPIISPAPAPAPAPALVPVPGRRPIDESAHPDSVLLKPEEAADRLRLSRARIYELTATGELESIKIDGSRRVPLAAIIEFIQSKRS